MLKNVSIMVVEPENENGCRLVRFLKKNTEANIYHAKKPTEALEFIGNSRPVELLLTDIFCPDNAGLELIQKAVAINPAMVPIVVMPIGGRNNIVEALQAGAYFYIHTPYHDQEILEVVKNALEYQKLLLQSLEQKPRLRKNDGFAGIIGESLPMKKLFKTIERIAANSQGNVLIKGESGTGKELVARAIHDLTPERCQYNFVPLNCAAIPGELLESELFGYEKGAFTGANRTKKGRLEHADKGTLFLDEIGDMKPGLQAKLLRVLQEQNFEAVGSVKTTQIDVRVIAATHRNLEEAVANKTFREDLYYRLSVVPINLPPLRQRIEDIPHLVAKFLLMYNRGRKSIPLGFTDRAMKKLMAYDWPGNVRELQNLVQRMCILHGGDSVDADALPQKFQDLNDPSEPEDTTVVEIKNEKMDFHAMTMEFENQLILKALHMAGGNKKEAANLLNMKRTTLLEKIKKRKLDLKN